MAKKKRRPSQARRWRRWGWWAGLAALPAVIGVVAYLVVSSGPSQQPEGRPRQAEYLVQPAAAFSLPTLTGDKVSLSDHLGRHNLLLFFNEGVGCGPCYQQIADLEKDWDRFQALDVELISIMVDPVSKLAPEARFFGVTGENSIVAVDEDKSVSNAYNALEASMHPGQKPGHTFSLVNKQGNIIWRWDWSHGDMYLEVGEVYKQVAKWLEQRG